MGEEGENKMDNCKKGGVGNAEQKVKTKKKKKNGTRIGIMFVNIGEKT